MIEIDVSNPDGSLSEIKVTYSSNTCGECGRPLEYPTVTQTVCNAVSKQYTVDNWRKSFQHCPYETFFDENGVAYAKFDRVCYQYHWNKAWCYPKELGERAFILVPKVERGAWAISGVEWWYELQLRHF